MESRCGACRRRFSKRSDTNRHIANSSACRKEIRRRLRTRLGQIHAELARHDSDSDPERLHEHDGLRASPRSPIVFQDWEEHPGSFTPPTFSTAFRSNPYRTTVEEASEEDEDAAVIKTFPAAGSTLGHTGAVRISEDFANLTADGPYGPWGESKTAWEFARWSKIEAVRDSSISRLLQIKDLQEILGAKSARDVNAAVDSLPAPAEFNHCEVSVDVVDTKFDLYYRDPLRVIADLLADPTFEGHLHFSPERHFTDSTQESRQYTGMHTGDWWWNAQTKLKSGRTVVPVILSTDKTQLTSFTGKQSCYPVYLTIGNIENHVRRQPSARAQRLIGYLPCGEVDAQLFHKCMAIICQSLFKPAKHGVKLVDSRGNVRRCHPLLAAYVADYPEQCLVACVRYGQACPRCSTLRPGFGDDSVGTLREQADTLATIHAANSPGHGEKGGMLTAAGLNDVPAPFWAEWRHANIHCALTSDILHQLVQGVGKHVVEWLLELAPERELDARMQRLPEAHGVRHFKNGVSILSNISGLEHKAIYAQILGCVHGLVPDNAVRAARALLDFLYTAQYENHSDATLDGLTTALSEFHKLKRVFSIEGVRTDFNLPKLHAMQHYIECIRLFGTTDGYNTEATERLHIDLAKHAFDATNKREFVAQMCRWLQRRETMHWFATYLAWKSNTIYDARLRPVATQVGGKPIVLAKRPQRPRVDLKDLAEENGVVNFKQVLEDFLRCWLDLARYRGWQMQLPDVHANAVRQLDAVQVWNHVTFSTPNTQTKDAPDVINKAYASASRSRFDTVLVKINGEDVAGVGGLEGTRVGQLRAIFKLPALHEHQVFGDQLPGPLAFVDWFTKPHTAADHVNGMYSLEKAYRADGRRESSIIELVDVRRACQLVPKFGTGQVDRKLRSNTILEGYDKFYLNQYLDKDAYRSMYWNDKI
ncbi:hypothetical protein BKA62DRAFT_626299 [Auriculariales sp. MPI-PUGE-AT-0066]|nr:hypothetical protein BKA62DRAFT_626299 [Auriculariales sp. MPI-PUGE-AT-0066]